MLLLTLLAVAGLSQGPTSPVSSAEITLLNTTSARADAYLDAAEAVLGQRRYSLADQGATLTDVVAATQALAQGSAALSVLFLTATQTDIQADVPLRHPEVELSQASYDAILDAIAPYHLACDAAYQEAVAAQGAMSTGDRGMALERFHAVVDQLDAAEAAKKALLSTLAVELNIPQTAAATGPAFPDPWPVQGDITNGHEVRAWLNKMKADGPEADGVYRCYLPAGELEGVAFSSNYVGPDQWDPDWLGGAELEIYGRRGWEGDPLSDGPYTKIRPETKSFGLYQTPGFQQVVRDYPKRDQYAVWDSTVAPSVPWTGDPETLTFVQNVQCATQGYGTSWHVGGVSGWEGRIHHYDMQFMASSGNVVSIGKYCPTPTSQPVLDCQFTRCQFVGVDGIKCVRPVSANFCGLGFYDCLWKFTAAQVCEHAVYTRNALWCEMIACEVDGIGAQVFQGVNRKQEFESDCYGDLALGGYLLIEDCLFKRPGLHGSGCGGGPGAAITIAGAGWDWTVRDTIVWDDGQGKDHNPSGVVGGTYAGLVAWNGGFNKSHLLPSGKTNGVGLVDGLYIWFNKPTRSPMDLSDGEGAVVTKSYFSGGGNTKPVDLEPQATPIYWDDFNPDGETFLIQYGAPANDILIGNLRYDGVVQGSADAIYSFP